MNAVVASPVETESAGVWRGGAVQGLCYGALGLPLAFVALPLYVILPAHYASTFGIPLVTLGVLLLAARGFDALTDPWIGRLWDAWFQRSPGTVLAAAAAAAVVLALGFRGLFFPPLPIQTQAQTQTQTPLLLWCFALLTLTYLSYSLLSVMHQAWGARLGGDQSQRARIVSWREGLALVGVLVASVLPSVAGIGVSTIVFAAGLAVALVLLARAPRPGPNSGTCTNQGHPPQSLLAPLHTPDFRRLLLIYLVNGVASAVPATLVLFFIRDRLAAPTFEPLFLASYFAAGALSMPLWGRLVDRVGLPRAWLAGMALAVVSFGWAALLGSGDVVAFTVVCVASGFALGADLSLPSALLTGVIQRAGHAERYEGSYFGWWNLATKLNLALAAGIALPLLGAFGYAPGARDAQALWSLTVAYCLLPCVLKLAAAGLLWNLWLKRETAS
ncbi:MAG: MFS transporter [Pseudomonadota bacterium]|nr:MFS transporter [Pseudomonadota bacterium]